jgi:hypothetical protein
LDCYVLFNDGESLKQQILLFCSEKTCKGVNPFAFEVIVGHFTLDWGLLLEQNQLFDEE